MATVVPEPSYPVSWKATSTPCPIRASLFAIVKIPSSSIITTPGNSFNVSNSVTGTLPASASMP